MPSEDHTGRAAGGARATIRVDVTRMCLRQGAVHLPAAARSALPQGEALYWDEKTREAHVLTFAPPARLEGLEPFFRARGLRPNDALVITLYEDGATIDAVVRPRAARPRPRPEERPEAEAPSGPARDERAPVAPADRPEPARRPAPEPEARPEPPREAPAEPTRPPRPAPRDEPAPPRRAEPDRPAPSAPRREREPAAPPRRAAPPAEDAPAPTPPEREAPSAAPTGAPAAQASADAETARQRLREHLARPETPSILHLEPLAETLGLPRPVVFDAIQALLAQPDPPLTRIRPGTYLLRRSRGDG